MHQDMTTGALALASGVTKSGGLFHLLLCHAAVELCHKVLAQRLFSVLETQASALTC
jgi:hypothetical protein